MNAPRTEAKRWLLQSKADLEVVRTLRSGGHHAPACFYSQQAAEKALKAVLFGQGNRVVLGHSVRDLLRRCEPLDPAFAALAEDATLLDQFYIPTRYPNGLPSPAVPSESYTATQSQTAEEASERVMSTAAAYLNKL
jgi:HEPN domain-containing protein